MRSRARSIAAIASAFVAMAWVAGALAAPSPLVAKGQPADWVFVYKFNAKTGPTRLDDARRGCPFGENPDPRHGPEQYASGIGQTYAFASSSTPTLQAGVGLAGVSDDDPLGATFGEVWRGAYSYVVYNDQFVTHPEIGGCGDFCAAPWAHAKGVIAWTDSGEGIVLQVTTPSWPGAGSQDLPRQGDGNTLGCVHRNNLLHAQHFFALKLSAQDTADLLDAAYRAGVPTNPGIDQIVHLRPGSPANLSSLARRLGDKTPTGTGVFASTLSSGVQLIAKPADLQVPPWQLVSATLGGESLEVATWMSGADGLPSTRPGKPGCWAPGLGTPGRVDVMVTGRWDGAPIALMAGTPEKPGNHGKLGVSLPGGHDYVVFGDMNQEGGLVTHCGAKQNPRGGFFFAMQNPTLAASMRELLGGDRAADNDRTVAEGAKPWTPPARRRRR